MNEKVMSPLPVWEPDTHIGFNDGMMYNAAFIVTNFQQRSDLGDCIICTRPPHYVAKVHAFKTSPIQKEGNERYNAGQRRTAERNEIDRQAWLQSRADAIDVGMEADEKGMVIKDMVQEHGTYDEEFDEPRIVAKVPGLNVYLELLGCLDKVDNIDWDGEFGAIRTMELMSTWIPNNWTRDDHRRLASKTTDMQPLPDWQDSYDPTLRHFLPKKAGIGVWPHIDASRRPELLHVHMPTFEDNADIEGVKLLKMATAEAAAKGHRRK